MSQIGGAKPTLFIFGGPNGAGKTTVVQELFNQKIPIGKTLNADRAAAPHPTTPLRQRQAQEKVKLLTARFISQRTSFNRESTLNGKEIYRRIEQAKIAGFDINFHFVGVNKLDLCSSRIKTRVEFGEHDVPLDVQKRRFKPSFDGASKVLTQADSSVFWENNGRFSPSPICIIHQDVVTARIKRLPKWMDDIIHNAVPSKSMSADSILRLRESYEKCSKFID